MEKRKEPALMRMQIGGKMQAVRADDLQRGKERQNNLTPAQLALARRLYGQVGQFATAMKRKQWVERFCTAKNPNGELGLWIVIAEIYEKISPEFPYIPKTKKAGAVVLAISRVVNVSEIYKVPQKFVARAEELRAAALLRPRSSDKWSSAMFDLEHESPIPLCEVPSLQVLPVKRGQKRLALATIYRWANKGLRGNKLETKVVDGVRYTSHAAVLRFFERLNKPGASPNARTEPQRAAAIARAKKKLAKHRM
jgi:hypothetical protein